MPEAPEVNTVLKYLKQECAGHEIVEVKITHPKLADNLSMEAFEQSLLHQHFRRFFRHGKYLVFEMDTLDWVAHMRMEGKFFLYDKLPSDPKTAKHIHAFFKLDDGRYLAYQDTRKFGRMQIYEKTDDPSSLPVFDKIGPDILDEGFNAEYLLSKLKKKAVPIKSALLDQSIAAGIGNIYADEILFDAGIHPLRQSKSLSLEELEKIVASTKKIIKQAMEAKGTTIRSFAYSKDHSGSYQDQLKVHLREGQPCPVCSTPIEKTEAGQRSTYLCPKCQK